MLKGNVSSSPVGVTSKPWYKKWWFITIVIVIVLWFGLPVVVNKFLVVKPTIGGSSYLPGKTTISSNQVYNVVSSDDPITGSPVAPITIVEFGDFECPFCREAVPIINQVLQEYPEAVRLIYRDFPITELHSQAMPAAVAANCAAAQGKFWEFYDLLFQQQDRLGADLYKSLASSLKLELNKFNQCLLSPRVKSEIQDDYQAGLAAGVTGTPTWFINGYRVQGVIPVEIWRGLIPALLKEKFKTSS